MQGSRYWSLNVSLKRDQAWHSNRLCCHASGISGVTHNTSLAAAGSGERIQEGNSVRDQFLQAIYDQLWANLKSGGVAQGSNFWNLYTVGIGNDDPYQITLADTSTVGIIDAHASPFQLFLPTFTC